MATAIGTMRIETQAVSNSTWDDHALADLLTERWGNGEDQGAKDIFRRAAKPLDRTGQSVLDVGCGIGRLRSTVLFANYLGVDSSPVMVERCHEKGIEACQGSIYNLDFSDELFDFTMCNAVLFHLADPFEAIRELWRVTGKRLVFSMYFRPWNPLHPIKSFWNEGEKTALWEDRKRGKSWWCVQHHVPAWQIRRLVSKYIQPSRSSFIWKRGHDGGYTNCVYVTMDR